MTPLRQLLIPTRHPFQVSLHRSAVTNSTQIQRRTLIDARRIASPQSLVQVDRLADYIRDEQIATNAVRLKTGEELGLPQDLQRLLRNLNRRTHTIVQLGRPDSDNIAIVQVYEKTELLKQVREKEERIKQQLLAAKERKPKQIELNWAISENDLELKLRQLETFLDKGKKVEILLASKKKQRKASVEEGTAVLKKLRQKVRDIGAKEVKALDGQVLKQASMTVQK